jgi:hypothetical protein
MLGLGNARLNALEAENRTLRAELVAQTQRTDALSRIIVILQKESETYARQLANMTAVAQAATQQAQAGRGYCIGETPLDRVCRN